LILLIDNYDSFVYNLARYFQRLGQETVVLRNDRLDAQGVLEMKPEAVVLSPGPCTPNEAGCSLDVVRAFHETIPMLGICLGHQTIAAALGGRIVRAAAPMHGRTSEVFHDGCGIFAHAPSPLTGCRYHSLVVDESTLPACLEISARTADGTVMAIRHRVRPVIGLQFHPESILTHSGYSLLAEFLRFAERDVPDSFPATGDELKQQALTSDPGFVPTSGRLKTVPTPTIRMSKT
jgi:anthranilate synthase/aminodeoxychorismate synthase-like glutamine amidotransferase